MSVAGASPSRLIHAAAGNRAVSASKRPYLVRHGSALPSSAPPVLRQKGCRRSAVRVQAAATNEAKQLDPEKLFFQIFPPFFKPYFPAFGERSTIKTELVEGQIWGFEQQQQFFNLAVNIRCTIVKLQGGGLFVYAPVAPTKEFLAMVRELEGEHGKIKFIIEPTYGIEHKVFAGPFSRRFPDAKVFVPPGLWQWPLNLPSAFIGLLPTGGLLSNVKIPTEWDEELECRILTTRNVGAGPFIEATFFHKPSKTLLVTDVVLQIPADPPEIIETEALLETASDVKGQLAEDTPENRRIGWGRMSLLTAFFGPGNQRTGKGEEPSVVWSDGWQDSFKSLTDQKLVVSPVLRSLVFSKSPDETREWVDCVTKWNFERIIPAHESAPIEATPEDLKRAFHFVYPEGTFEGELFNPLEGDMGALNSLQANLGKVGLS